jgi:hypothetical protein
VANLRTLEFAAIMLVSLSMGMAFCHLLEMPVRLQYELALWAEVTTVQNTYQYFGPPFGASIEGAAWVSTVLLSLLYWRRGLAGRVCVLIAAISMVAVQVVWWTFVLPVNREMADWTNGAIPDGFSALRTQWEYAHASRAVAQILALALIVYSVLWRGPRENPKG